MRIAFIGCGRVAGVLAQAFARAGREVVAVTSRSSAARDALSAAIPGCAAMMSPQAAAAAADLVFLTVPDGAIGTVAAALDVRPGQSFVHCSGATEVDALAPLARLGAHTGGFHPLQIFSDPASAARALPGSVIAIEAAAPLCDELARIAEAIGCRPMTLRPGARPLYHAAANHAASFVVALLVEAQALWEAAGLDRDEAIGALLPLAAGTVESVRSAGLAQALAGPFARGDAGVVERHLSALDALGADHAALYRQLALRALALARAQGRLSNDALAALEHALNS